MIDAPNNDFLHRKSVLHSSQRFALRWDLSYKTLDKRVPAITEYSQTVNLSSSGVWFLCEKEGSPSRYLA